MIKIRTILAALAVVVGTGLHPALAQEHASVEIAKQPWTFAGVFGTFDRNQLQRGFQVFRDVCASCHTARLLAFRNLSELNGPEFTEGQVKALAASYTIADGEAADGQRPGIAADRWPGPSQSPADLISSFGVLPPDLSVMAKARSTTQPFPWWILNYVTAYAEGGPDYVHALLEGYRDEVPAEVTNSDGTPFTLPEGKYYNDVFPGHAIGMPPPLSDGVVTYDPPAEGETAVPQTADQYARDVSAFLMWVAEPHLVERKETGFRVILFLFLFAVLMYLVKRRLWSGIPHHNPPPATN